MLENRDRESIARSNLTAADGSFLITSKSTAVNMAGHGRADMEEW